jgi:predicted RNA-binding Zn-ribbon protein involved in translation (DUF1610 family)
MLITLIMSVFAYLVFPSVYINRNGKVDEGRAKLFSLLNSITVFVICIVLGFLLDNRLGHSNLWCIPALIGPAVVFYFVNCASLSSKVMTESDVAVVLCPMCGYQMFPDDQKCEKCTYSGSTVVSVEASVEDDSNQIETLT